MEGKEGWIFVLGNEAMPGLLKIGFSLIDPAIEAEELSNGAALPLPYIVKFKALAVNAHKLEQEVRDRLEDKRIKNSPDFFRCSLNEVTQLIRQLSELKYEHLDEETSEDIERTKRSDQRERLAQQKQQADAKRNQEEYKKYLAEARTLLKDKGVIENENKPSLPPTENQKETQNTEQISKIASKEDRTWLGETIDHNWIQYKGAEPSEKFLIIIFVWIPLAVILYVCFRYIDQIVSVLPIILGMSVGKLLDPVSLIIALIVTFFSRSKWIIILAALVAALGSETIISVVDPSNRSWGRGIVPGLIASLLHAGISFWLLSRLRKSKNEKER